MLRNHGLLVVGRIIADAFLSMYTFENACRIQIDAQAGGMGGAFVWPSLLRRLERNDFGYRV